MTPFAFLKAVLPPAGYGKYCVVELSTKRKKHVFVDTLDKLAEQANLFDAQKLNTFFALATFATAESREAQNAQYIKAMFVDVDCGVGHAYATARDGVLALESFIAGTGLINIPEPIVVATGGGIHAYWPLEEAVLVTQWKPVAERLKRLAKEQNFAIDHAVTADTARVLRVPGTSNWKIKDTPRPCVVRSSGGGSVSLDVFASAIGYTNGHHVLATPRPALVIPGVKPRAADTTVGVKLMQNTAVYFKTLLTQVDEGKGCAQIRYYIDHAAEEGLEPLWRAVLSIAKPCEDGRRGAEIISAMHPYAHDRMEQKLQEIKGPYPCTKFDTENPGVCEACPYWGKITNPLNLCRELHADNAPKVIELTPPPAEAGEAPAPAVTVNRPAPPMGYSYGKHGGVYEETCDKSDPDARPVLNLVLPYDLFVVNILNQEREHHIHLVAVRPEGTQAVTIQQRLTVTKDDLCKALAHNNIMASNGNDARLFKYVRSCIENASANTLPLKVPTQYGWQSDDSFVYDGKILTPGMETVTPLPGLDNIVRVTKPAGDIEGWRHTVNMLAKYKLNDILALMTVGFGAPLMRFTAFDGLTFHIGSSESGTGKSVALETAASIWGHPTRYMVGKDTSGVAMQQRLGLLNSLPLICDEITQKNRLDFEWFPGFVFDMTDGKGKERMEGGANKERVNTTYWSTLALVSSNTHIMDYFSSRKHSSQGEIMRLLELKMTKRLEAPPDLADALKNYLPRNYGIAGARYIRWIVDNMSTAKDILRKVEDHLKNTLQKSPDERFWIAGIAACMAGAILAGSGYANVVDLPLEGVHKVFAQMIESARGVATSSKRGADDVLNAYTREFFGKFVVVRKSLHAITAAIGGKETDGVDDSITRTEVCGRIEIGFKPGLSAYYIEEQLLKRYCASMSFGYTDLKKQLSTRYGAYAMKKDMLHGTRGPAMNVNVLRIVVPSQGAGDGETDLAVPLA